MTQSHRDGLLRRGDAESEGETFYINVAYMRQFDMAEESKTRTVIAYATAKGKVPFQAWLRSIRDARTQVRILRYLERLKAGNLGDHKGVGEGVREMRLFFGTGYRIYFAEDGDRIVVLLCGGDKKTQRKDIKKAIAYWSDYKERKT
jgi:putative addiction module killer protein